MYLFQFLALSAVLFSIGVYGVLARRNAVLVLMSIELILNAVNINLVAMGAFNGTEAGEVFALFVIAVAAAEVGIGLAIVEKAVHSLGGTIKVLSKDGERGTTFEVFLPFAQAA